MIFNNNDVGIKPIVLGGTGANNAAGARNKLGLGTVAIENVVPVAKGGTGASTAAKARENLGLGAVSTLDGVPISRGGTGANNAEQARTNLGIGRVATEDILPVAKGGTGNNVIYNSIKFEKFSSSSDSYICRYYPFLRMCFFKATIVNRPVDIDPIGLTNVSLPMFTIYDVTEREIYAPANLTPLYSHCYGGKDVNAMMTADGCIEISPTVTIPKSNYIYIEGFWFIS